MFHAWSVATRTFLKASDTSAFDITFLLSGYSTLRLVCYARNMGRTSPHTHRGTSSVSVSRLSYPSWTPWAVLGSKIVSFSVHTSSVWVSRLGHPFWAPWAVLGSKHVSLIVHTLLATIAARGAARILSAPSAAALFSTRHLRLLTSSNTHPILLGRCFPTLWWLSYSSVFARSCSERVVLAGTPVVTVACGRDTFGATDRRRAYPTAETRRCRRFLFETPPSFASFRPDKLRAGARQVANDSCYFFGSQVSFLIY